MSILAVTPPKWWSKAACAGVPTDTFFPDLDDVSKPDRFSTDEEREAYSQACIRAAAVEARAKAICAWCPVSGECLSDAVARGEQDGIFGGINFGTRRNRRAAREAVAAA